MPLEELNRILQFASVVVLGLTFAIGAGAVWTSYLIGKRQEERTAKALADAAKANERAGKLELEAAQQRERAANAERELLEMQERMTPRRLTAKQRSHMSEALKKGEGRVQKKQFAIWWPQHSPEPEQFARDIIGVFEAAGWTVVAPLTFLSVYAPVPVGVVIAATAEASDTADVIYEALRAADIAGGGELRRSSTSVPDDVVLLKVGVKPTISTKENK
jgi:hypothetical protein